MKLSDILLDAASILKGEGIDSYFLDARLLLAFVLGVSKENLLVNLDSYATQDQIDYLWHLVRRRADHEPISHIIGKREFFGRDFLVNSSVLDPRPDSEVLIEAVLEIFPNRVSKLRILELGVGSGCLILTILSEFPNSSGLAVDISNEALKVAISNSKILSLKERIDFIYSDWFSSVEEYPVFDLIIANPPYIPISNIENLQPEILKYEPMIALNGGDNGLEPYRKISSKAFSFLNNGGFLVLEIGYGQKELILKIFNNGSKLSFLNAKKDLAGIDRCLIFRKL
jgi:release factor glutamine methyltransferase